MKTVIINIKQLIMCNFGHLFPYYCLNCKHSESCTEAWFDEICELNSLEGLFPKSFSLIGNLYRVLSWVQYFKETTNKWFYLFIYIRKKYAGWGFRNCFTLKIPFFYTLIHFLLIGGLVELSWQSLTCS